MKVTKARCLAYKLGDGIRSASHTGATGSSGKTRSPTGGWTWW